MSATPSTATAPDVGEQEAAFPEKMYVRGLKSSRQNRQLLLDLVKRARSFSGIAEAVRQTLPSEEELDKMNFTILRSFVVKVLPRNKTRSASRTLQVPDESAEEAEVTESREEEQEEDGGKLEEAQDEEAVPLGSFSNRSIKQL